MSNFRFNRPITAALVVTSPVWAVVTAIVVGLLKAAREIFDFFASDVIAPARWSIVEPVQGFFGAIRRKLILAKAVALHFYFSQVAYRLSAIVELVALPLVVLAMLVEGEDIRDIIDEARFSVQSVVDTLRFG